MRRRVEAGVSKGLNRAYTTVRVDPDKFLLQLRAGYRVPISGYHGVFSLEIHELDVVGVSISGGGLMWAGGVGGGLGRGGLITIVPDLGVLSAITMRTVQKLSLLYGFQFNTDDEIAELWIAAASAAGLDVSREFVEREVVQRFVPRVIQRIAAKGRAGADAFPEAAFAIAGRGAGEGDHHRAEDVAFGGKLSRAQIAAAFTCL